MLAKLKLHNKFLILIFFLASCGALTNAPKVFYHTELNCPTRGVILVRYATIQEVQTALTNFYNQKKANNSKENYTIISLSGNRSFKVDRTPIEEMMECTMRQIPAPKPNAKALKNMYTPGYDFVAW